MTIVASWIYKAGRRDRELPLEGPAPVLGEEEFAWIGLVDPTSRDLRVLQSWFGLHDLAVEDVLNAHQSPKLDVYDEELFIVAKTAAWRNDNLAYGETHIFVGERHIITIRHGDLRPHGSLRAHLEQSPVLLRHGVDYVLHGVLDHIVDGYLPIVDDIEDELGALEARVLEASLTREQISDLFVLRRDVIRFKRILTPMAEVCSRLEHLDVGCIDANVRPYFRDVLDHINRVQMRVDALREQAGSVFEVSTLMEAQRQTGITRKLAAWAAILAVPTAIAGIYGMNFDNMPELRLPWGYFAVLGVIAAVCIGLFIRFRQMKWL
jgi:magnesium transporter